MSSIGYFEITLMHVYVCGCTCMCIHWLDWLQYGKIRHWRDVPHVMSCWKTARECSRPMQHFSFLHKRKINKSSEKWPFPQAMFSFHAFNDIFYFLFFFFSFFISLFQEYILYYMYIGEKKIGYARTHTTYLCLFVCKYMPFFVAATATVCFLLVHRPPILLVIPQ